MNLSYIDIASQREVGDMQFFQKCNGMHMAIVDDGDDDHRKAIKVYCVAVEAAVLYYIAPASNIIIALPYTKHSSDA